MVYNYSVNVSFPTEGKLHTCANIGIILIYQVAEC